jgi:hypothetical protein
MKLSFPTVQTVLTDAGRVLARFPFVVLAAVVGTAVAIVGIEVSGDFLPNVLMACALGVPLMLVLRLFRERWISSSVYGLLLEVAGILVLAWYARSLPMDVDRATGLIWIRFFVLDLSLHFAVAFIPCLCATQEAAFWQFNRRLFQRFALSVLYSAVLYLGLTLAISSADKLFSLRIDGKCYSELWVVMVGIFNTLFFLGGVPGNLDELARDESYPKGLRAFAQFALAPLVIVFVAILYLYSFKIIRTWTWPHGWVALPVCCLAVVGILAALLLQPTRSMDSEPWGKWYWKYFFKALWPLSLLLILSLQQRISAYGITEWRYFGLVVGGWLFVISACFAFRPGGSTRLIPASLALICFLSVAGPWSAFSVSVASQKHRLLAILESVGAIENGTLVPAKQALSMKNEESVRSILYHWISTYGGDSLPVLLPNAPKNGPKPLSLSGHSSYQDSEAIISYLRGNKITPETTSSSHQNIPTVNVDLEMSGGLPVAGYRKLYHACVCPGSPARSMGDLSLNFPANDAPVITFAGKRIDVSALEARLTSIAEAGARGKLRLPPGDMKARLVSNSREWLVIVDRIETQPSKTGRGTLVELEIYLLEK